MARSVIGLPVAEDLQKAVDHVRCQHEPDDREDGGQHHEGHCAAEEPYEELAPKGIARQRTQRPTVRRATGMGHWSNIRGFVKEGLIESLEVVRLDGGHTDAVFDHESSELLTVDEDDPLLDAADVFVSVRSEM